MTELRRSLVYSAAQSYISVALQLVSTAVISRILTPAQVGVFAVATVFAALASNVRDFGIAEYLIQAKDLDTDRIRAAFAANIVTSWSMALAMWLAATPVGDFYHSPQIGDVMRLQCFNFVLIPFGAINMAWFRRELNFKPIFLCGVGADLLSLVVAIVLALRGLGAMSLAWASLTGVIVTVVVSMALRPASFPRWPGLKGIGEVLRFGSLASIIYALGQLGKGAPEMILGRLLGVTSVAIFSRGVGLVQMFKLLVSKAITPVCMPYFAKAAREEGTICRAYARCVAYFSAIGFTSLGFLSLAAFPLIRLVYGSQWDAAVPLARVLCIAGAIELIHVLAKEALMSDGSIRPATRLQTLQQIVQVSGLLLAFPFGLAGAAWGMLGSAIIGVALAQHQLRVSAGFTLADLWSSCRASLIVAIAALLPMLLLTFAMPATPANFLWQLAIGAALTTGVWIAAMRLTAHPLWAELARAAAPLRARLTLLARHSRGT